MSLSPDRRARAERPRRPLLRSFRFWIPVGILVVLIVLAVVGAVVGKGLYDRAMAVKASLEQAVPLASTAKDQVIAGDTEAAKATAAELAKLTADARAQTDDASWKSLEWVPLLGPNLYAVRTAAAVTDDLVTNALTPATGLSLDALKPQNGAINIEAINDMGATVDQAAEAVAAAQSDLETIDRGALIPQVDSAIQQLTDAVDQLQPVLGPAQEIIGVLPAALGAETPRNYLVVFQNNAEARGTGGNPAALVLMNVDKGKISIAQQASSADFRNARPDPVTALNPETEALYGDKVGRWISDATMTPDFRESAGILRAWWAEEFDTPIDAVVSFDPVALSYLLQATGPAVVSAEPIEFDGETYDFLDEPITITSENAVPLLLNEAYWRFPDGRLQDAFFAASARAVFDALTSGKAQPKPLLDSLMRAVDEDRLMYAPSSEAEAKLVAGSKLSGQFPSSNEQQTVLGVYVNDFTQSKLDYYLQLDIAATSTQCSAPQNPVFTTTATLTNTVTPEQAPDIPHHIAPARFFPKGHIASDVVLYGPIGSSVSRVTVDGRSVAATPAEHLGRGAVKVAVINEPGQTHTIVAEFHTTPGQFGALTVRHTPMVRDVSVSVESDGCE